MQFQEVKCKQLYVNDSDRLEVEISPFFEGSFYDLLFNGDYFYFVGFKDVEYRNSKLYGGITKSLDHMLTHPERTCRIVPDIKERFATMHKVSEEIEIYFYPELINSISCSFRVKAIHTEGKNYKVNVYLKNHNGEHLVKSGTIIAKGIRDFLDKCDRYCSVMLDLAEMLVA